MEVEIVWSVRCGEVSMGGGGDRMLVMWSVTARACKRGKDERG